MKITTTYIHPPIPCRGYDWCAYEDGEEEGALYGWGRTEEEAIESFKMFCEERE
jgi:hypothetical protein